MLPEVSYLEDKLSRRERHGNLRALQTVQRLVDFASNDYLGLARSQALSIAVEEQSALCPHVLNGYGSTGSRLLSGNTAYAQSLEDQIARFHGYEAGLLFNCGYMANVGLLSTVAGPDDVVLFDSRVHASMHDGIRLSRSNAFPFRHNDLNHLEARLKSNKRIGRQFICIESIYSTDGSKAPLKEVCALADRYGACLIIDEAHAVGVHGIDGRGLAAEEGVTSHIFAQVSTFGKALGVFGAVVLGSNALKQGLINFATSYIYTTALPFHLLAAIKCSYELFPALESERAHLRRLIHLFRDAYPSSSETHIQSVPLRGNDAVKNAAKELANFGFDVRPLMSPTVRQGREVLRVCLHAFNTKDELKDLIKCLEPYRDVCDE